MKLSLFDYDLPEELIAQYPLKDRDKSRLMLLERKGEKVEHLYFFQILDRLKAGDLLVINDTKVIPARLIGKKCRSGGKAEILLLMPKSESEDIWEALIKPASRLIPGVEVEFQVQGGQSGQFRAKILKKNKSGTAFVKLEYQGELYEILKQVGKTPLPPYIKREADDLDFERYQTVYASKLGSAAAPTAGLHFTPNLIQQLNDKGVEFVKVTLHVGLGTFQPVRMEDIELHELHAEYFEISAEVAEKINRHKGMKGRIIAVGTTSVRTLETANEKGRVVPMSGLTNIFIYPGSGYQFKVVDALITNFHLPKSTLLMLVCAFAGRDFIFKAYQEAIKQRYRFYSYGDAMMIL